ncbi:hypothetical protein Tco_1345715 [Tanacetum coccineum]
MFYAYRLLRFGDVNDVGALLSFYLLMVTGLFTSFPMRFSIVGLGKWYTRGVIQVSGVSYLRPFVYGGRVGEKDRFPISPASSSQAVQVLSSNKAPFRRYPECFLALVGLSPYYPFGENTYPAFERPDRTDMGLLDYIRTADPRKVQAVEVQKGEEQVTLLDSIKHCFVSLDAPAAVHQASGSGSGAGPEVSAPSAGDNVVAEEDVIPVGTYVDLVDPEDNLTVVEKGDAAQKQPEKAKRKKLSKQSDPLPAKRLRIDHPSLASGTGGKTLASLRRTIPEGSLLLGSSPADVHTQDTVRSSRVADAPVYTAADTVTSSVVKSLVLDPRRNVGGVFPAEKRVSVLRMLFHRNLDFLPCPRKDDGLASEIACGGEFYPAYLTTLAGRRWLLTHSRAVDYGMQEGLAAGHEHGVAGTPLSAVVAYNPETAESNYLDAVRALEEAGDFFFFSPWSYILLKSKKDSGMDEVLDCFLLDGPLENLPEAAHLQPCLEQLSVPIYYADVNVVVGDTSLSFALLNVHTSVEGAKRQASTLRRLMVDIVSHPLFLSILAGAARALLRLPPALRI